MKAGILMLIRIPLLTTISGFLPSLHPRLVFLDSPTSRLVWTVTPTYHLSRSSIPTGSEKLDMDGPRGREIDIHTRARQAGTNERTKQKTRQEDRVDTNRKRRRGWMGGSPPAAAP
ncbi:hypothetical protein C8R47DRAFT_80462 [Mycena vitilis]|nr:hypothetical protein C8R47DRAFT_80462 [Mycena vitilis]